VDVGIAFAEAQANEAKVFKMIGLAKLWGIILYNPFFGVMCGFVLNRLLPIVNP
jgi:hypothetical protein